MYSNDQCLEWCPVRVSGQCSEEFGMGVGVHQGSVLSPLLFILVLEVLLLAFCTGMLWKLLYPDDPVLAVDPQEDCISKLKVWKMKVKGCVSTWRRPSSCWPWRPQEIQHVPVLYASVVSASTRSSTCSASCGSTRGAVASLIDWWLTYTTSAPGVTRRGLSMVDQWLIWISTTPCMMWKPLSTTWATCCAPVGAATVP